MNLLMHIIQSRELIEKLHSLFPSKKYKTNSPLFYEGHIPTSGYLIINGSIQISQKNKFKKILEPGSLIGLSELIHKVPSTIKAEACPNTELCFLDKITVLQIIEKKDNDLSDFFKKIVEKIK